MSIEVLSPQSPQWKSIYDRLPIEQKDVFYSPEFADLCQTELYSESVVKCATSLKNGDEILYPYVERDMGSLTGIPSLSGVKDISSLYGRGGLVVGTTNSERILRFHEEIGEYFHMNNIFCGFDRYHPIITNDRYAGIKTQMRDVGGFVVVDLSPPIEDIESSFVHSTRKHLRKADRNELSCVVESNGENINAFLDIYYKTMDRNAANGFYYFKKDFFCKLGEKMKGMFHFFYVLKDGKAVSCELVLHHGIYCHSFLGGTTSDAMPLCANHFLKREIVRFYKSRGCRYFLLGGGSQPNDGIFNFKKSFAPDGVLPSRIGFTIWNTQTYDKVRNEFIKANKAVVENRFQFYDPN